MRSMLRGLTGVLAAAIAGYALVEFLPHVFERYDRLVAASPMLGRVYLVAAGLGAAVLGVGCCVVVLRLWSASRASKRKIREESESSADLVRQRGSPAVEEKLQELRGRVESANLPAGVQDSIREEIEELYEKLASESVEIAAFGTVSSGKGAVLNALAGTDVFASSVEAGSTTGIATVGWPMMNHVELVDTPGIGEVNDIEHRRCSLEAVRRADLTLLVLDGPMKDDELRVLEGVVKAGKPTIVCLNKSDWFDGPGRDEVLDQVRRYVGRYVRPEDVVAVRTAAARRMRVRVLPDGTEVEEAVALGADVNDLVARMRHVLRGRKQIVLANAMARARGVDGRIREALRGDLDARAQEVVNRYAWQSASAVALNPIPVVDVLVGLVATARMVVELAHIYQVRVNLDLAWRLIGVLLKSAAAIWGINTALPAVGSLVPLMQWLFPMAVNSVGSALKTVPGIGTVAGSVLQGLTQVLIVRWAGNVFIEYFRTEMSAGPAGIEDLARQKWRELTLPAALAGLEQQFRERFI